MAEDRLSGEQQDPADNEVLKKHTPPAVIVSHKVHIKRERLLTLLRERYGYTNEKSVDELTRLLQQFLTTNASFHIHTRRNIKPPLIG